MADAVIKQTSTDKALYDRIRHLEQELTEATLSQSATKSKAKGSKPAASDHILGNYGHEDQQKYLEKECPKTSSAKEVNTWTTRFLTKEQQRSVQSHSTKLKNYIQVLDKDTQLEELRKGLIERGMPTRLAGSVDFDQAVKTIAAVYIRSV